MTRLVPFIVLWISLLSYTSRAAINPPSGLTGTWVPAVLTLEWTDNSDNEAGFFIRYRGGSTGAFQTLANVAANVRTYTLSNPNAAGCQSFEWTIVAFTGTTNVPTETSAGSNVLPLISPPRLASPLSYASPLGYVFSYCIRLDCPAAVTAYEVADLPPGLTVDTSTGIISGTPSSAGNYTSTITVTYDSPPKTITGRLTTRIYQPQPVPAQAPVALPIPARTLQRGAPGTTLDLTTFFSDPDATSAVRVVTTEGNMDFAFYGDVAPLTVANFMNYVNREDFANTFFHRSVPGFVIQGGGFRATTPVLAVATDPPVQNEFLRSNLCGSISMAKLGGNPNSATCQFFISLDNNSANLDSQNGGFTVFGRVAGDGLRTAYAIASRPTRSWTAAPGHGALTDVPVTDCAAGLTYDATKLVKVLSVSGVPHLVWSASSSLPSVCGAGISGRTLTISPLSAGAAVITLTATDLDGLTAQGTVQISVEESLSTWLTSQAFGTAEDAAAGADPDHDSIANIFEYAWLQNPKAMDPPHWPVLSTPSTTGGRALALTFPVRKATGAGFTYTVLGADAPGGPWLPFWTSADGFTGPRILSAADHPDHTLVTVMDSELAGPAQARRFLRLRLDQN